MTDTALSPSDLGFSTDIFPSFRPGQEDLATQIVMSQARFPELNAPCGSGKSLINFTAAVLSGYSRALFLVPTIALQDQLMGDFESMGLASVKGQSNYRCPKHGNCEAGAQHDCPLRKSASTLSDRCPNLLAIDKARQSSSVVTNPVFWMTQGKSGLVTDPNMGIGLFDFIILDEAHKAAPGLAEFCTLTFDEEEAEDLIGLTFPSSDGIDSWSEWGRAAYTKAKAIDKRDLGAKERYRLTKLAQDAMILVTIHKDTNTEWIFVRDRSTFAHKAMFRPVWAHAYAEPYLFQGAKKVVMSSATLLRTTGDYLGIDRSHREFIDVSSSFPVSRRPLIYVPTLKVDYKTMSDGTKMRRLVGQLDSVLSQHPEWKGLIHTHSYKLADIVRAHSKLGSRMIFHGPKEVRDALHEHKRRRDGSIIVSPAFEEGLELPGDLARYNILLKIPQVNRHDPVEAARVKSIPSYAIDYSAERTMQMVGRTTRYFDDWSWSMTFDDHFAWIRKGASWPQGFAASIRREDTIKALGDLGNAL